MNRTTLAVGLVVALVLPATGVGKPPAEREQIEAAHAQCKLERGKTKVTREAFEAKYHGMSRCVRENAAEESAEEQEARTNASKECKAEAADANFPKTHEGKSFAAFYGANGNGRNAHGKCVSIKAKAKKAEMDAADAQEAKDFKNAAKACARERGHWGRARSRTGTAPMRTSATHSGSAWRARPESRGPRPDSEGGRCQMHRPGAKARGSGSGAPRQS